MALRNLVAKMRIPAAAALRTPPRISPPAGARPRLYSSAQIDRLETAMAEYRLELALSNASIDETMRRYEQDHQSLMKKFDMTKKAIDVLIACQLLVVLIIHVM